MDIAKLVGFYQRTLVDHHKDRDCHFSIVKKWSYGDEPVYAVEHDGYIHEFFETFQTNKEAEEFLSNKLIELIRGEIEQWREMKADDGVFGCSQQEIDQNRVYMEKLDTDLKEFLTTT